GELEVHAVAGGGGLDRVRVGGAPGAFGADLGEADDELFGGGGAGSLGGGGFFLAAAHEGERARGEGRGEEGETLLCIHVEVGERPEAVVWGKSVFSARTPTGAGDDLLGKRGNFRSLIEGKDRG